MRTKWLTWSTPKLFFLLLLQRCSSPTCFSVLYLTLASSVVRCTSMSHFYLVADYISHALLSHLSQAWTCPSNRRRKTNYDDELAEIWYSSHSCKCACARATIHSNTVSGISLPHVAPPGARKSQSTYIRTYGPFQGRADKSVRTYNIGLDDYERQTCSEWARLRFAGH